MKFSLTLVPLATGKTFQEFCAEVYDKEDGNGAGKPWVGNPLGSAFETLPGHRQFNYLNLHRATDSSPKVSHTQKDLQLRYNYLNYKDKQNYEAALVLADLRPIRKRGKVAVEAVTTLRDAMLGGCCLRLLLGLLR